MSNKNNTLHIVTLLLAATTLPLLSPVAHAAGAANSLINIKATVYASPCTLNTNKVNVDFGQDIDPEQLANDNHAQPIPLEISCPGNYYRGRSISMMLKPNAGLQNSTTLKTSSNGLGINVLANGRRLNLSSPYTYTYGGTPPKFQAALVSYGDGSIPTGDFSASATAIFTYD